MKLFSFSIILTNNTQIFHTFKVPPTIKTLKVYFLSVNAATTELSVFSNERTWRQYMDMLQRYNYIMMTMMMMFFSFTPLCYRLPLTLFHFIISFEMETESHRVTTTIPTTRNMRNTKNILSVSFAIKINIINFFHHHHESASFYLYVIVI